MLGKPMYQYVADSRHIATPDAWVVTISTCQFSLSSMCPYDRDAVILRGMDLVTLKFLILLKCFGCGFQYRDINPQAKPWFQWLGGSRGMATEQPLPPLPPRRLRPSSPTSLLLFVRWTAQRPPHPRHKYDDRRRCVWTGTSEFNGFQCIRSSCKRESSWIILEVRRFHWVSRHINGSKQSKQIAWA